MNKRILFFLFLISRSVFFSQEEVQKDSIVFYLNEYKKNNDLNLLEKATIIASQLNNDSLIKITNIEFGLRSYFQQNSRGLLISQKNLLKSYNKNKDSFSLAKYYHYKALNKRVLLKMDSSFYYYHQSKNISILQKDSLEVARRLLSMARMQERQRDYLGAEISTIDALKYIEPLEEYRYTSILYNNLGLILSNTNRQKEARKNYLISWELNKKNPSKSSRELSILDFYTNMGLSYARENKNLNAIEYYKKGLKFDSLENKYPNRYQNLTENLADSYNDIGDKIRALKGFKAALKSKEKHNNLWSQSVSHSLLANYFIDKKENIKALFHAKKGLSLAKKTNNNKRILENLKFLSSLNRGEKGKKYLNEYIKLSDSINYRDRNLKNQFAKIRYETEKKDKENAGLKEENTKKQLLLESEQQQKTISWLIAGASILFLAFGFTIASNRRKKLLFESKLQQVEAREKERQQIAKSLHDEVAGDIRMLHLKLAKANQIEEANSLESIKENVRNLSHQLSSESFDKVSFKDQIINLVSDYFDSEFLIKVKEMNAVEWGKVNNSIQRMLFLSIRESIQNIDKYANAKNVVLTFSETKKTISLIINDDGKGFNVDAKKKGIGLKNMKERVEEINGNFSILSELNKGTTIAIEIPKNGR